MLQAERLRRGYFFDIDITFNRAFCKFVAVSHIRVGERNEQPAVEFDALFCDFSQNPVFLDAFLAGFHIFNAIPAAAVQKPVRPPGGSGGDFAAFIQLDAKTAHL